MKSKWMVPKKAGANSETGGPPVVVLRRMYTVRKIIRGNAGMITALYWVRFRHKRTKTVLQFKASGGQILRFGSESMVGELEIRT
jgi:hypothetical protein